MGEAQEAAGKGGRRGLEDSQSRPSERGPFLPRTTGKAAEGEFEQKHEAIRFAFYGVTVAFVWRGQEHQQGDEPGSHCRTRTSVRINKAFKK